MAINYYLVYTHENAKRDTGTNVYANDEAQAKAIGAILLTRITGETVNEADLFVDAEESMTDDQITTT